MTQTKFEANAIMYNNDIALVFDVIQDNGMHFSSTITDNWLENNTAIQNAISINPLQFTVSGLVGEVVFTPPRTWNDYITEKLNSTKLGADLTNKLGTIPSLIPDVDNYTQLAKNAVNYAENAYSHYKSLFESIQNVWQHKEVPSQTKQEVIAQKLITAWKNRTEFQLKTPWGTFSRLYILDGNMTQNETNASSALSISLKETNFTELKTTTADQSVLAKYNSYAKAQSEAQKLGKAKSIAKEWRVFG